MREAHGSETALTNLFTGRAARGIVNRVMRKLGPMSPLAPAFPLAGGALMPLRAIAEPLGSDDFMNLWAGQALGIRHALDVEALTRQLASQALEKLRRI